MATIDNPARILVIEDSEADIFLIRHALDEVGEDYELTILRDGEEALRFVRDQRTTPEELMPCVVVLDLHLPKYDGIAILNAIREEPDMAQIRVVALTTFASPRDEAEVLSLGVRLYRSKPTDLDGWISLGREIIEVCRETVTV